MKADVLNVKGEVVESVSLNNDIFKIEPNMPVVHQYVKAYLANQRQGTQSAKTRAEVRGGGKKPWRQKGTGRARVGSSRNPVWTGGGVAFAPKPRDYSQSINKKMKRLAMKSVFSAKVNDKELFILDELKFDAPKTKAMVEVFDNLKINKTLVVIAENDKNVVNSVRNIKDAKCATVGTLNVYEMLKYNNLILTKDALTKIEEVYK
ncbi:50S ribosomal protein L4 [Anaerofustis stercorihominis]|uniref:Large ribosomal subunit protein uL4 n=2 Tax=Anaerofustis stercorihominis TaxID=214853 RepID=B1CA16_9FIRM|nr:50S ribosomal protein L4 [Anaerofustis stercorihominis]EDS72334.1 50S ribosomal protein L4 [Anaerofustis stercorihominis DSM 17244]MCQ4795522.1 50S ribosomal protein L4 [Anaerofustis stercorihominis]RGD73075.1 50S ribosomal protein L4 [Anaerofustis stercorihominis]